MDRGHAAGEHGRGEQVLGGAHAGEVEGDLGAVQPIGGRLDVAIAGLEPRPHRLEAGDVHVDRSCPEVVATGQRQTHVSASCQQRTEHIDRGPDPLDQLERGNRGEVAVVGDRDDPRLVEPHVDPDRDQQVGHDRHVDDRRNIGDLVRTVGEQTGCHQLQHRILAPGTTTSPRSGPTWRTVIRHSSGCSDLTPPVCPAPTGRCPCPTRWS